VIKTCQPLTRARFIAAVNFFASSSDISGAAIVKLEKEKNVLGTVTEMSENKSVNKLLRLDLINKSH
jgi:hypothetical protein